MDENFELFMILQNSGRKLPLMSIAISKTTPQVFANYVAWIPLKAPQLITEAEKNQWMIIRLKGKTYSYGVALERSLFSQMQGCISYLFFVTLWVQKGLPHWILESSVIFQSLAKLRNPVFYICQGSVALNSWRASFHIFFFLVFPVQQGGFYI